jgi:taurine dioxygenase
MACPPLSVRPTFATVAQAMTAGMLSAMEERAVEGVAPAKAWADNRRCREKPMNERVNPSVARPVVLQQAGITIRRVGVNLGAEISGVDLRHPPPDAQFAAIESALVENELIIFRDQEITSDQLIAFGRRFGELTVHPFAPNEGRNAPELIKFRNDERTPPFGTDVWHSDETFRAEPPMATMLCAKEVPAVGGDTMFVSMTAAFDGLSDRLQHYISGLAAIHDMKPFRPLFGSTVEDRKRLQQFELIYPPQVHPVVRVHPVSGRKVLFVNPQFTLAVDGMEERESRSLLDTLFHQALIPEYQFRLHWQPHTIAVWDNRSTQHYAIHDYYPQRRYMERVTIRGGPVTGVARADPASVRRAKYVAPKNVDVHGGHKPH